jgi:hypothetical protein
MRPMRASAREPRSGGISVAQCGQRWDARLILNCAKPRSGDIWMKYMPPLRGSASLRLPCRNIQRAIDDFHEGPLFAKDESLRLRHCEILTPFWI